MCRTLTVLGLTLIVTSTVWATAYEVRPDGTGDFPTIQEAIDRTVNGDLIVLTDGDFTGPGNRDLDFQGKSITLRSQNGDPLACRIWISTTPANPQRGF